MKKTEWYQIFSFCKKYFEKVWLKFGIIIGLIITGAIVANATPLFWGQIIDCLTNVKLKDLILYLMLYFGVSYVNVKSTCILKMPSQRTFSETANSYLHLLGSTF